VTTERASIDAAAAEDASPSNASPREPVLTFPGQHTHAVAGWVLLVLGWLALASTLVARTLAPALPGTAAGIEQWIRGVELAGALLSVNLFVGLGVVLVWLGVFAVGSAELPRSFRIAVVPATSLVVLLAVSAYRAFLFPSWLLWMSLVSAGLAFVSAPRGFRAHHTRAPALILAIAATSSLVEIGARAVAIRASELALASWFGIARVISTLGFVLDVALIGVVLVWIAARRLRIGVTALTVALVASGVLAALALFGANGSSSTVAVLAARALDELVRHPTPLVVPFVRFAVEIMTLVVAAAALLTPGRSSLLAGSVVLTMLASGATDIPLCALMMSVAALTIALEGVAAPPGVQSPPDDAAQAETSTKSPPSAA
jgi:hypothetical protein